MTFRIGKLQIIANTKGAVAMYWHSVYQTTSIGVAPCWHLGVQKTQGAVVGRCWSLGLGPVSFARVDVLARPHA